jgi:hypothetical protein
MATLTDRDPRIWGAHYWYVFQCTAAAYPKQNPTDELRDATLAFFNSFRIMLPCLKCREHYEEWLKDHPPPVEKGQQELMQWVTDTRKAVENAVRVERREVSYPVNPATIKPPHPTHLELQQTANQIRQRNAAPHMQQRIQQQQQQQQQRQRRNRTLKYNKVNVQRVRRPAASGMGPTPLPRSNKGCTHCGGGGKKK